MMYVPLYGVNGPYTGLTSLIGLYERINMFDGKLSDENLSGIGAYSM